MGRSSCRPDIQEQGATDKEVDEKRGARPWSGTGSSLRIRQSGVREQVTEVLFSEWRPRDRRLKRWGLR